VIKKQGVTTGPAGEKLSVEEMDQKRRDILSKIRQEEFDLQGGEASIAGFDHVKLRQRLKGNAPL
jgi:hypothetical protein